MRVSAMSIRPRISRASLRNTFPSGVRETGRLLRSNSFAPTFSSSARICWVIAVCEMYWSMAALVKLPVSATDTK